jgi:hypothetical protein
MTEVGGDLRFADERSGHEWAPVIRGSTSLGDIRADRCAVPLSSPKAPHHVAGRKSIHVFEDSLWLPSWSAVAQKFGQSLKDHLTG